jgi:hypothetical protein
MVQRPNAIVFQEYEELTPVPVTPDLDVLVVGPCYQLLDYLDDKDTIYAGDYGTEEAACPLPTQSEVVISSPPGIAAGAEVVASSVKVFMDEAKVVVDESSDTPGAFASQYSSGDNLFVNHGTGASEEADLSSVAVGDVLITNSSSDDYRKSVKEIFTHLLDGSGTINFVDAGVKPGDTVVISADTFSSSRNGTYTVLRVRTKDVAGGATTASIELVESDVAQGTTTDVGAGNTLNIVITGADGTVRVNETGVDTVSTCQEMRVTSDFATSAIVGDAYTWRFERAIDDIELDSSDVTVDENEITIAGGLTVDTDDLTGAEVIYGKLYTEYRALRQDLQNVTELDTTAQILNTLGKFDARNPLCVGAIVAKANTATTIKIYGVTSDDLTGYLSFLDRISAERKVYALVPLTQETSILASLMISCETLSNPNYALANGIRQKFRVCIGSIELQTQAYIVNAIGGSTFNQVAGTAPSTANFKRITTSGTDVGEFDFVALGAIPGWYLDDGTNQYTITHVVSSTVINIAEDQGSVTPVVIASGTAVNLRDAAGSSQKAFTLTADLTLTPAALADLFLEVSCPTAQFISSGVVPGDFLQIPRSPSVNNFDTYDTYTVSDVVSETRLEVVNNGADSATLANELPYAYSRYDTSAITGGTLYVRVMRNYTKSQQVDAMVAVANSFASKRLLMCYPNRVDVTDLVDGSKARNSDGTLATADPQPGYYLSCTVGGLTAGQPSQQGFTNVSVAGIDRIYDSSEYFTEEQLTDLSNGGLYVFVQDNPSALPYSIHAITTDTSSLEFSEYMVTKNFDFISWTYMDVLLGYLGKWNVMDETIEFIKDSLKSTGDALKSQYVARIGAPLKAYNINSVHESELSSDRVEAFVNVDLPMSLNTIGLHLVA